jgi:6-pyruvoyltetrahydropterin/6-carboxytetrahydropterin synthase
MKVRLVQEFRFEAAHRLPRVPPGHKCAALHGHSYRIDVAVSGPVGEERGWLIDFQQIHDAWMPLFAQLDHHYLNDIPGLENPTSEILAAWLWERLTRSLPGLLERITVFETQDARCEYEGH